ncbi:MAG: MATE family efflux transporter [Fusobacteriaceae bacterium]
MQKNLLQGDLKSHFVRYLFPAVAGNLSYGLLIFIDTIFIGRGIGTLGLASLNVAIPVYTLVAFGMMLGIGGATASSIDMGRGDEKGRIDIFSTTIILGIVLSLFFSIFMSLYLSEICRFLGANDEIFELVKDYVNVISKTIIFYIIPHILTNFIRNDNNPKLTMYYLIVTSSVNIILDYLFIFPLHMGMEGAALATSLAQLAGTVVLLTHFLRKENTLFFKFIKLKFKFIKRILQIGASSFINEISMGIIIIISNYQFFKYLGNEGVSAFSIVLNIKLLVYLVLGAFGQAMQPILSVNYGANKIDRVRKLFRIGNLTMGITSIFFYLLLVTFSTFFIRLFNRDSEQLLNITKFGFPIYFLSTIFMGVNLQLGSFFQSVEYNKVSSILNLLRGFVIIGVLIYLLPFFFGVIGLWCSYILTELFTMAYAIFYYKKRFKKHHQC